MKKVKFVRLKKIIPVLKSRWSRIKEYLQEIPEKPILATVLVLVFMTLVVISISWRQFANNYDEFVPNVIAESFGTLFDLAIIGVFLLWINKQGEKKVLIRGYHEEIDDFRNWKNEEATFKILGCAKRLNKNGVTELELHDCYLRHANMNYLNLKGSNLNFTNMEESNLVGINLEDTRMNQVNLQSTKLNQANLRSSLLTGANLKFTTAIKADFEGAMLIKADFEGAFLMEANLRKSLLVGANFTDTNLYRADLREAEGLSVDMFEKVRTIHMTQFDPPFERELRKAYPQLFSEQEEERVTLSL